MNDKFFDLKKEKQDAMINAALKVFAQYGYRFASTDEMVKEAHISKGLLFHYFGSKLGLYTFVYDYAVRYVSMEISSVIAPSDHDFFELCRKYEAAKLSICRTYPYMFLFLHKAQDEDIEEAELAITDRRTELQALYQQTLQQSDLSSFHSEEEAMAVYNRCQGDFTVSEIRTARRKRNPLPPFITSTLQQEASTKLSFSAKRTMSVAQRLYEGIDIGSGQEGLITYMRTDSTRLSDVFIRSARDVITETCGKDYLGFYRVRNDAGSQDAHEAIRPTSLENTPEKIKGYLTSEQYRLYKMIYARALASLMSAAQYDSTTAVLSQNGCDFNAQGSTLVFDGFLKVYGDYDSSKDVLLPKLDEGEQMTAEELKANQHFTEPPARYTEARLIKTLEEDGIGRPSTYAMIIDTIQQRGYVTLEKATEKSRTKVFRPTEQGVLTTEKLDEFFDQIINVDYTAKMEEKLDSIAEGSAMESSVLHDFYNRFQPLLEKAYEGMEKIQPEKVGETCPECGGDLVYRNGKYGKFISCANFPKCRYTRQIEKDGKEKPEPAGKMCPRCGHELLKRRSRYGTYFLGCSDFPRCNYMESLTGEEIVPKKTAGKSTARKTTRRRSS